MLHGPTPRGSVLLSYIRFDTFASIQVLDVRTYGDVKGLGFEGYAGTDWGIGYTNGNSGKSTTTYELLHDFDGKHAEIKEDAEAGESTFGKSWFTHSILGGFGYYNCHASKSYKANGSWIYECTISEVRDYIDDNF